jgi:hypothetical protein
MATNEFLGLINDVFGPVLSTFPLLLRYSDRIGEIAHAFSQRLKTRWPLDWALIAALIFCRVVRLPCSAWTGLASQT